MHGGGGDDRKVHARDSGIPRPVRIWSSIDPTPIVALLLGVGGIVIPWLTLLLTLVLIFSFQGEVILSNPLHIVLIAVPLVVQTIFIFFIAYLSCLKLRCRHDVVAPAGMIGASNFFALAVAVAITLFGASSPVVLATIVGVLVEVPVMLVLVKLANRTRHWFPANRASSGSAGCAVRLRRHGLWPRS